MATWYWTGAANDGNHNNGANWQGGTAPSGTGTEDIVFNSGNSSMTTNIDAASVTYAIGTLTITPGFGGNIGSTSAAYTTASGKNIGKVICAGRGQYYKIGCGGTVSSSIANQSRINLSAGTTFVISSGTWQYVFQEGGTLQIEAAAVATSQIMLSSARALIQTNATAITLLEVDSASDVTSYRNVTTGYVNSSSTLRAAGAAAVATSHITGATFNIANTSATTHTTCNLRGGGRISLANCAADPTLTNLYQWTGTSVDSAGSGVTFTITNTYAMYFGPVGSLPDV